MQYNAKMSHLNQQTHTSSSITLRCLRISYSTIFSLCHVFNYMLTYLYNLYMFNAQICPHLKKLNQIIKLTVCGKYNKSQTPHF